MRLECDIVSGNMPLVLGLDVVNREEIIVANRDLHLQRDKWTMLMKVAKGHFVVS